MRRYHEPVEVRRGLVGGLEAPEQFLWRGRLWLVTEVVAHWIETGAWWEQPGVSALLGLSAGDSHASDPGSDERVAGDGFAALALGSESLAPNAGADLLGEREVWRVEAGRGRAAVAKSAESTESAAMMGCGVFDLAFDWGGGQWQLVCSID